MHSAFGAGSVLHDNGENADGTTDSGLEIIETNEFPNLNDGKLYYYLELKDNQAQELDHTHDNHEDRNLHRATKAHQQRRHLHVSRWNRRHSDKS